LIVPASEGAPLEGPFRLLVSYVDPQGGTHTVLPRTQVTIVFQDG
jgi:hypothetical protein